MKEYPAIQGLQSGLSVGDVIRLKGVRVTEKQALSGTTQQLYTVAPGAEPPDAESVSLEEREYVVVAAEERRPGPRDFAIAGYDLEVMAFSLGPDGTCDRNTCDCVMFRFKRSGFTPPDEPAFVRIVGKLEVRIEQTSSLILGERLQ